MFGFAIGRVALFKYIGRPRSGEFSKDRHSAFAPIRLVRMERKMAS
ncbi:MAG TPA: hypothetical protein VGH32_04690 [Pirellulales bacterium]